MRSLVTGGSGEFGTILAKHLADRHEIAVLDLKPPADPRIPFVQADILDLSALESSITGFGAVVHLAAIRHPLNDPPEKVFCMNTMGTFNVLEACSRNGVSHFVFASSDSTIGLVFGKPGLQPDYLPIDEEHPLRPEDPYGLSKLVGEEICKSYARKTGMSVTVLRPSWIFGEDSPGSHANTYRAIVDQVDQNAPGLWSYVHAEDLARAVEAGLTAEWASGCEAFFISAADTASTLPTAELISRFYPGVKLRSSPEGRSSLISTSKAQRLLGWRPQRTWRDLV